MKTNNFIIILFLISACASLRDKKISEDSSSVYSRFNIYRQYWNVSEDSLNLFLHIDVPLTNFVFKKRSNYFYCDISYTLVVSNSINNVQVYRESWNKEVSFPYYEDTRNPINYFSDERNIKLLPGEYKIFLNIQDKDSQRNWQINEKYTLEKNNILGPTLPYINDENHKKIFGVNIIGKTDTIWIRTQVYLNDINTNQIDYIINRRQTAIDSGKIKISDIGKNHLYYLPIPISKAIEGKYEIILNLNGYQERTNFNLNTSKSKPYWTNDIDEIVGVMEYIIQKKSEYKKFKFLEESYQWDYVDKFWKSKDPSPETIENELLMQLNKRVKFSNKNFSIRMPGWKSDRGRVYIIYGAPDYIEDSSQDHTGYTYQKWVYPNGKQFIFVDMSMSGDYSLYREI